MKVHVPKDVTFVTVSSGGYASYGIDSTGRLWAWGDNSARAAGHRFEHARRDALGRRGHPSHPGVIDRTERCRTRGAHLNGSLSCGNGLRVHPERLRRLVPTPDGLRAIPLDIVEVGRDLQTGRVKLIRPVVREHAEEGTAILRQPHPPGAWWFVGGDPDQVGQVAASFEKLGHVLPGRSGHQGADIAAVRIERCFDASGMAHALLVPVGDDAKKGGTCELSGPLVAPLVRTVGRRGDDDPPLGQGVGVLCPRRSRCRHRRRLHRARRGVDRGEPEPIERTLANRQFPAKPIAAPRSAELDGDHLTAGVLVPMALENPATAAAGCSSGRRVKIGRINPEGQESGLDLRPGAAGVAGRHNAACVADLEVELEG